MTLTFPSNTEANGDSEGTTTWTDYVNAVGGMTLENTLYVYSFTSAVTHELLKKGVYYFRKAFTVELLHLQVQVLMAIHRQMLI